MRMFFVRPCSTLAVQTGIAFASMVMNVKRWCLNFKYMARLFQKLVHQLPKLVRHYPNGGKDWQ